MVAGTLFFVILGDPDSIWTKVALFVVGTGITGETIASNYLSIRFTNDENRGIITGAITLCQAFGAFYNNFLGSYLFTYIHRTAPFIMFIATAIIAAKILTYLYVTKLRLHDSTKPKNER